ncbi:pullulanase-type alpha-1,6-glucosidase [Georgenia wutianyii]|uniref:Pullulanase-type alpha-1,6-glucosidase n=1 Tax=Georgenia wutianyii TaxID=2585135 RepID=A0ABX5VPJ1_9MICO|nr:pullulanase-type alpha-1,6-glucosidase [Georgenia wutianyii]QDB80133.1 pullulanase-type alpha-1,6-glucosidase [Georgenia wutianyii]
MSARSAAVATLATASLLASGLAALTIPAAAEDALVVIAGDLQSELGCPADWAPDCADTALAPTGEAGRYSADLTVPAGSWEYKVAVGGSWDEAYGVDGGETNYALRLAGETDLRLTFDHTEGLLSLEVLDLDEGYTEADAALVAEPVRQPGADEQFYFVMTDRFADGDPANNTGGIAGSRLDHGFDPADKGFYHGGDLAGLHENLDYIEGLGTTAIWLTPSFKNNPVQGEDADASAGYHGYWITDFTQIDPHLGTNAELEALIADAHARGIKVYFDIITNHTADVIDYAEGQYSYVDMATSPYRDAAGEAFDPGDHAGTGTFPALDAATSFPYTPVVDPAQADVKVPAWLNDVTLYHNRGDSTWSGESVTYGDFVGLDDLMTEHPTVVEGFVEVYQDWVDLGIDGFRIDTAKHVNIEFWEEWTTEVLDYARAQGRDEFFMFGEVYDADARLLSPYVRDTDMNGVLDFAYQSAAVNYAKGLTPAGLSSLFAADAYYTTPTTSAHDLPTFLGNHDMGRVGYFLQGSGDELDRSLLAHSLMYLTRGQPVVYYGDEQGFVGQGGDKDSRQSLFASQVQQYQDEQTLHGYQIGAVDRFATDVPLYAHISDLAELRSATPALATGAQVELHAADGVYAFARVDRTEKVEHVVALNNQATDATVTFTTLTPGAGYTSLYGGHGPVTADETGAVTLTVPALDAVVLVADATVGAPAETGTMTLTPAQGGRLDGVAPVTADVADDVWAETSFAYRLVGGEDWTPLGTAEGDAPRVFHDVTDLPTGTLVEYRAVSVDAAGHRVAASTVGSVGQAVDGTTGPEAPPSDLVTVPGSHNAAMGCPGDWQPDCAAAALTLGPDGVYTGTFDVPAGSYEYKVAVGGSWEVNYGVGGVPGGDNATYTHAGGPVTFVYDPVSHYFSSTADGPIITLPGSFQSQVGCPADWQPECLATWMTDPDGDGTYEWSTTDLATGSYEVKVAHGRTWSENYGVGGVLDGANIPFSAAAGKLVSFSYELATHVLTITVEDPPLAGTGQLAAHWLDETTIAWPTSLLPAGTDPAELEWSLHHAAAGGLEVVDGAVTGADGSAPLTLVGEGLPDALAERFPHLAGHLALRVEGLTTEQVEQVLTGQVQVLQTDGVVTSAFTGVQVPGVLDDLYADAAAGRTLGVDWSDDGVPTLALWAPTAQDVELQLWTEPAGTSAAAVTGDPEVLPMTREDDGTWTVTGEPGWEDAAYRFAVTVYAPAAGEVVTNEVTDPYAVGLTENSTHSVLVDLDDPRWAPELWTDTPRPVVERPVDRTIYELHVRDFSISDETVPQELRGTYRAFTQPETAGMQHLRALADAGMNTVHLLPTFDIATIEEDPAARTEPVVPDAGPASPDQQAALSAARDLDGFNWGYDPWHFSTPEGSYATERDGGNRTAEFRAMVGGLHDAGLQVVVDKVYNHTNSSGQDEQSVLDRVVPGYYHRLNAVGNVETSTCCQNVATEHEMAEKLMVDSVLTWARDYGVDGFRFDLMGHHSRDNMLAVRDALDSLTLEDDGVDGESIYVYGEGWDFGEVAGNARFEQATQGQLGGTGIGTFSDRLRDAVRGGGPFDEDQRTVQGFGSGSFTDPNAVAEGTPEEQAARLAHQTDLVRLGLAGNLADYSFLTSAGEEQTGAELDYNGQPAGYATQPDEVVTYVDAHDNETLFDNLVLKLPVATSMADRVRMNTLSLATTALSQTPSFWHAGTDLLRSKSLDRNSYNSGDHFNRVDWSMQTNNFGVGLPPADDNGEAWDVMAPLLADPALRPAPTDIEQSAAMTQDLLELRFSTDLFRLGSAELIHEKVTFPGSGPDATPGLLVMAVDDTAGAQDVDPALDAVLTVFNASPEPVTEQVDGFAGRELALSPVQVEGADDVVRTTTWDAASGTVTVPARTVAVLVEPQEQVEPTPGEPGDPGDPTDPPADGGDPTDDPTGGPGDGGPGSGGPDSGADGADRPGAGQGPGSLPRTGVSVAVPVAVAMLLLLAGAVLVTRRRLLG